MDALGKARLPAAAKGVEFQVCDGYAVLIGDCFADGRSLAFVEASGLAGLALAARAEGKWEILSIWNVVPVWIPKGREEEDFPEYYNIHPKPPENPYKLVDLDGDRVPELLVNFNDDGYSLGYAIIKLSKGEALPKLLDVFSSRYPPQARAGYFLTFRDSKRKSWWGETNYHRWEKGLPVHVATWHDDAYDPENDYWQVTRDDSDIVLRIYHREGFEIKEMIATPKDDGETQKAYATVKVDWKPGQRPSGDDMGGFEEAELYLFEKLTGIPAAAFNDTVNGKPIDEVLPLMKRIRVRVTGSEDAVRKLSQPVEKKRK